MCVRAVWNVITSIRVLPDGADASVDDEVELESPFASLSFF
jgi:hypothetical protein